MADLSGFLLEVWGAVLLVGVEGLQVFLAQVSRDCVEAGFVSEGLSRNMPVPFQTEGGRRCRTYREDGPGC